MGKGGEGRRSIWLSARCGLARRVSHLIPLVLIVVTIETEQLPVAPVRWIVVVVVVLMMNRELPQILTAEFAADPAEIAATVARNGPAIIGSVTVSNLADLPMTGLQVAAAQLTSGYSASGTIQGGATAVPALGEVIIDYELTANATAGAVLRPCGSRISALACKFICRNCSATMKRCSSLHTTNGAAASSPVVRRRVSCSMVISPASGKNCLGWVSRETGHKRLPTPPARSTGVNIWIPCSRAN